MKGHSIPSSSSNGGTHRTAGGIPSYVEKGTIKDCSHGAKRSSGGSRAPEGQRSGRHGGFGGKTGLKMSRQKRGY